MRRWRIRKVLLAAVVLALSSPVITTSLANTVDIVHDGYGAHGVTTFWGAGYEGADAMAGVYMLNKTGGTGIGNTWSNGLIPGFCIELPEPPPATTSAYSVGMPDTTYNSYLGEVVGSQKANYLRELWAEHYDPAWASGGSYTSQQNSMAETFAAAVWEIIYEDLPTSPLGWDVTADGTAGIGGFEAVNLDSDTANKWLNELTGSAKADLLVVGYAGGQDYLVAVPEPATIILLGLGGSLGLFRRRRMATRSLWS